MTINCKQFKTMWKRRCGGGRMTSSEWLAGQRHLEACEGCNKLVNRVQTKERKMLRPEESVLIDCINAEHQRDAQARDPELKGKRLSIGQRCMENLLELASMAYKRPGMLTTAASAVITVSKQLSPGAGYVFIPAKQAAALAALAQIGIAAATNLTREEG